MPSQVAAFYQFAALPDFRELREPLWAACARLGLKGSMLLSLESTPSRMSNLARQEMIFGRHISLDEIAAGIDEVTAEDVRQVAHDFFARDELALTVLGPLNGLKISRRDLAC